MAEDYYIKLGADGPSRVLTAGVHAAAPVRPKPPVRAPLAKPPPAAAPSRMLGADALGPYDGLAGSGGGGITMAHSDGGDANCYVKVGGAVSELPLPSSKARGKAAVVPKRKALDAGLEDALAAATALMPMPNQHHQHGGSGGGNALVDGDAMWAGAIQDISGSGEGQAPAPLRAASRGVGPVWERGPVRLTAKCGSPLRRRPWCRQQATGCRY